jgi:hypothetical protein
MEYIIPESRAVIRERAQHAVEPLVDPKTVVRVYSGKARTCCCGCSGKYSEDPIQIARVLAIIEANSAKVDSCFPVYVAVEVGARQYIAYLK